jgi:hypothetical protein
MKKYLIMLLLLSGCSSVPVTPEFPAVSAELKVPCANLQQLPADAQLSDLLSTVSKNYAAHHECRIKHDAWVQWYDDQKKIFDEVK